MSKLQENIFGFFDTVGSGIINNRIAERRENRRLQQQYELGEMAADSADRRTRNLYNDLYSPQAQLNQLKDAGLSPSIFTEGTQLGGATPTGAQGGGGGNVSPNVYGISALEAAQIELINAQKDNVKEDTRVKEAEHSEREANTQKIYTEIGKILADKGLTEANTKLTDAKTTWQELTNYIQDKTKEIDIRHVEYLTNKAQNDSEYAMHLARKAKVDADISEELKSDYVKQVRLQNANILADIAIKESNVNLNDTQREALINEIDVSQQQLELNLRAIKASEKSNELKEKEINQEWKKFKDSYELACKRYDLAVSEQALAYGEKTVKRTSWGVANYGFNETEDTITINPRKQ